MIFSINKKHINIDGIIALIYALIPFLQMYRIPGTNVNLCFMLIFVFTFFYVLLRYWNGKIRLFKEMSSFVGVILLISMFLYCFLHSVIVSSAHNNTNSSNCIVVLFHFFILLLCVFAFADREIRSKYIKYIETISLVMSFVVIIQILLYYGVGLTITTDRSFLIPFKGLLTKGVKQSLDGSLMIINGLFRPSAFFLEPAHFSQYCLIALASSLARNKELFNKKAIIISVGTILTTSGLGIASTFALWAVKVYFSGNKLSSKKSKKLILGTFLIIVIIFALLLLSQSFRMSITRIITASGGYNSALEGRLKTRKLLKDLDCYTRFFGTGYKNIPFYGAEKTMYYMTGIIELLYCQGIIGTFIFSVSYLMMLVKSYKCTTTLLPFYVLVLYIPYLIGSSNLGVLSLVLYVPLLFVEQNSELKKEQWMELQDE